MTRIVRGETKDAAFRKGHVVREEDIPLLLSMGKDQLYVWECDENSLHENDAAAILADICRGDGMDLTPVKEGKMELVAGRDGLFIADPGRLDAINRLGDIVIAARHSGFPVRAGDKLAGFRVIPLVIEKSTMEEAKRLGGASPLFQLLPFRPMRVGVVATGNEVFHNRIKDTFTPVIEAKLAEFGSVMAARTVCDDNRERIASAIRAFVEDKLDLVICTGGMSVDPDDMTPGAIKAAGADIVSYGAPVLPGAMFLMAYLGDTPVMGLPGCAMYEKRTIFDIILPRVAAGRRITRDELHSLGNGGLCLHCSACIYPACGFGKGAIYG